MHDDYHHRFNQTEHVAVLNDTDQTDSATSTRHLLTARTALFICFPTLFIIIGTIGNVVNLIVLYQRSFAQNNMAIALRTLAYLDLLVLWTILGKYAVVAATDWDPLHTDEIYCIAYVCYQFACTTFTNWIIALISLIRYINIKFPFYAQQYLSKRRTYTSLCVIAAVSCAPLIELFEHLHAEHSQTNITGVWSCLDIYFSTNHSYLSKLLLIVPDSFLPGICIVVFNFSTISTYRKVMQKKFGLQNMLNKHVARIASLRSAAEQAGADLMSREDSSVGVEAGPSLASLKSKVEDSWWKIAVVETDADTGRKESEYSRFGAIRRTTLLSALQEEEARFYLTSSCYQVLQDAERASELPESTIIRLYPHKRVSLPDVPNFQPPERPEGICKCEIRLPIVQRMLCISITFYLVLNLPFAVWYLVISSDPNASKERLYLVLFISAVMALLKYAHNTVNFMLYSVFSRLFQEELTRLINMCYYRKWKIRITN